MSTLTVQQKNKRVASWLLVGVCMIIIQVLLGGITRLTGSGLSITEWEVITGALPPLNENAWLTEFAKYKQTPQWAYLNNDFTLADFKFIFFWEWFHRLWARLIGIVFLVPFIYFLVKKYFTPGMVRPLIILFCLGALQGLVGWIMVASGLEGDAIYVKPTRLALHFIFALILLAYTWHFYLTLKFPSGKQSNHRKAVRVVSCLILLLGIQLILGALMAGNKAATAAPTWPTINGSYFPEQLWNSTEGLKNFVDNKILIHFLHRNLAYLLALGIFLLCIWFWKQHRPRLSRTALFLLLAILLQIVLGIAAVLYSPGIIPNKWMGFEWFAQIHQLVGMLLVLLLVQARYFTSRLIQP